MRILKVLVIVFLIIFIMIQFIPASRNVGETNPVTDIGKVYEMPDEVKTILKTSCYDCHSNHTDYRWYHNIQPIGLWQQKHIKNGKKELNFSEFGLYSARKQKSTLTAIANQVRDGEMPLWPYTLMHRDAKLSKREKALFLSWLDSINNH